MPWLKLKKGTRAQYKVASKSVYVISVGLLDNTTLECTLTAESTGRDCMNNVCQRLGLLQPDLFGLKYTSRRPYPKIRWVDLDRPLKKQLDKYAHEHFLSLAVMFYVHDVSLLEDETTRYHYFLQLKLDVIEGRLRCNNEQAIVLASYSLQAEFGDHDPEKHTLEYLQDFPLVPKRMLEQFPEGALTERIITQHANIRGINQQLAEVYYIVGAQQLDGYGQECFLAKDERGGEVLIGASLTGIVIRRGRGNGQQNQFFKWHDITNLVNHKRYFGVDCQNFEFSVQFMLEEPESAKYVWKMCVLQHTFYKMHASATEANNEVVNITLDSSQGDGGVVISQQHQQQMQQQSQQMQQQQEYHMGPPQAQHYDPHQHMHLLPNTYPTTIQPSEIQNFHAQQMQRVDMSPVKLGMSTSTRGSGHSAGGAGAPNAQMLDQSTLAASSVQDITANTTIQQSFNNYVLRPANSTTNVSEVVTYGNIMASAHSTNDLDQSHLVQQQVVPQYRPAPDYETAIRNKYGIQLQHTNPVPNLQQQQQLYTSQPSLIADALMQQQQNQNQFHNFQQQQHTLHLEQQQHHQNQLQQQLAFVSDNAYSSTPELNRMNLNSQVQREHTLHQQLSQDLQSQQVASTQEQILAELQKMNLYKPPPPYPGPYAKLASTSTPDLAGGGNFGGNMVGIGGSSPDLVSRRNLGAAGRHLDNGGFHKTFENLNALDGSNQALANEYRNAMSTEELNNTSVVYRIDNGQENIQQQQPQQPANNYVAFSTNLIGQQGQQQPQQSQNQSTNVTTAGGAVITSEGDGTEPIYQNQQQLLQALTLPPLASTLSNSNNQLDENGEPIYQNLPVHEKILYKQRIAEQLKLKELQLLQQQLGEPEQIIPESSSAEEESGSIHIDETVTSGAGVLPMSLANVVTPKLKGHVSRVAITNSRENVNAGILRKDDNGMSITKNVFSVTDATLDTLSPASARKKSVTKINIGRGSSVGKEEQQHQNELLEDKAVHERRSRSPDRGEEAAAMAAVVSADVIKNNQINAHKSSSTSSSSSSSKGKLEERAEQKKTEESLEQKPALSSSVAAAANLSHFQDPTANPQFSYGTTGRKKSSTLSAGNDFSFGSTDHHHQKSSSSSSAATPRTPSSKPRAGRKRWALNFGNKTGSLKSLKSESGSHKSSDSIDGSSTLKGNTSGFGTMMATLHGLTRSRPDLLAESMATFSQPSKMPKEEIGAYLASKVEEGEVMREFETIPKRKLQNCNFTVASMAENIPRNRFQDVLPYDENRVRLTNPDKENRSGYINASHISATVGPDQRFYVAGQGPLTNTVMHFWQMILQCDVHLIVMLTEASTSSKTSACIPYWPQKKGSVLELGDFKIVKKFSSESGDGDSAVYTTSTFHITHTPSKTKRTVWHLQYSDWSDHGCPADVPRYIEFLEEMSALRQHCATEIPSGRNRNPPVLVHCSAGVGRSGVTILCDILLYCVDHNVDIDIPKVLSHLRQQRMLMVQTIAQYKFVHTVLINYLKQSRLI